MASKQKILYGAKLEASIDDGANWVPISESAGIAVQSEETDYVDVTSLDSPGGRREFIPGLIDPGTADFEVGYTPDMYATLLGWKNDGTLVKFKSTLPLYAGQAAGDTFECSGYVDPKLTGTDDVSQPPKIMLGVRFSGAMTYTKGV